MSQAKKWLFAVSLMAVTGAVAAQKVEMPAKFYVYADSGSRLNHYIPAGWMGDFGDLKMNQRFTDKVVGKNTRTGEAIPGADTAIEIKYSAERKQNAGWAGIYWQSPANNWGDKKGGFDLTGYKTLAFKVRGAKGGEYIDKFFVGGITGQAEDGDSDEVMTDAMELTKDWKEVKLDLSKSDMKHIIGGFGFAVNADSNPNGATFYLDEVRFEK